MCFISMLKLGDGLASQALMPQLVLSQTVWHNISVTIIIFFSRFILSCCVQVHTGNATFIPSLWTAMSEPQGEQRPWDPRPQVPKSHRTPGRATRELNWNCHFQYKTFASSLCYIRQLLQRGIEINIYTIKIDTRTNKLLYGRLSRRFSDRIHFRFIISGTTALALSETKL